MAPSDASHVVTNTLPLALVVIGTLPAFVVTVRRLRSRSRIVFQDSEKPYEDEDGSATEASVKSFSTTLPIYLILGCSIAGLGLSTATAIQSTVRSTTYGYLHSWLAFACWVSVSGLRRPFSD